MIETEESIRQKYPLAMDEHEAPDPVKAPKPAAVPQPAKQREIAKETATVTAVKPQVQASPPKSAGQTPGKKADALFETGRCYKSAGTGTGTVPRDYNNRPEDLRERGILEIL